LRTSPKRDDILLKIRFPAGLQQLFSIFFHSSCFHLSLNTLMFSVSISKIKSFTQDFVQKYADRIREIFPQVSKNELKLRGLHSSFKMIQSISQNILESEQGNFFLKLVNELPEEEKLKIIAEDPQEIEFLKEYHRALVRCANCEKKEKLEKEFQKCSRCNSVYYCSKICQRTDWPSHKQICKRN
jgi:hypothetical protein